MKVLLHSPLHPALWVYLMEALSEHEFFIEPTANFEEGSIPKDYVKFKVVPRSPSTDYDVQILCLHAGLRPEDILKIYPIPIVFIEYMKNPFKLPKTTYPLITTCKTNNSSEYPKLQYWCPVVSRKLWDEDWVGNKRMVMSTVGGLCIHPTFSGILDHLKLRGIPLDYKKTAPRVVPFQTWKSKFVHSRVLLEMNFKPSSFTILEAMTIGMPIVSSSNNDAPFMVRDKVDGFSKWGTREELADLLIKFLDDYEFAKEWGIKSKKRGNELNSVKTTKEIWNNAFSDAIKTFKKNEENPFGYKKIVKIQTPRLCPICKNTSLRTTSEVKGTKTITKIYCNNCNQLLETIES